MTIKSDDIVDLTGITYRQLDRWVSYGVIPTIGTPSPGSGHSRDFEEDVVEKVKLLLAISKSLKLFLTKDLLAKIYNAYDDGCLQFNSKFGYEIVLTWERVQ